jgi:hypothetical protein
MGRDGRNLLEAVADGERAFKSSRPSAKNYKHDRFHGSKVLKPLCHLIFCRKVLRKLCVGYGVLYLWNCSIERVQALWLSEEYI